MATINVKDAAGSTVALEKPLAAGQALMAASRPVVIASDQSAVPVSAASLPLPTGAATESGGNLAAAAAVLGVTTGTAVTTSATGTVQQYLRGIVSLLVSGITVATHAVTQSGSWVLSAGAAVIGKVGIDQTTDGTTNLVRLGAETTKVIGTVNVAAAQTLATVTNLSQMAGAAISMGTGVRGAGVQRVTIATDDLVPVTGTVISATQGYTSGKVTVTRPANVTAYTANDVVGGAITFPNMGPSGGGQVLITSAKLELDIAAVPSGMAAFYLYLYSVTPPSAIADNGAFDIPSGDRASFIGKIPIGTPVDEGSTLFIQADQINAQIAIPSGASIFGYLVTSGAFTPAANSEVYVVTLHAAGL